MKNDQRSGHGSFVRTRGEKSSVSLLADNSDIFFFSVAAYFPNFPPLENKTTTTRACRYQRDSKERRDAFFIYGAFFFFFRTFAVLRRRELDQTANVRKPTQR